MEHLTQALSLTFRRAGEHFETALVLGALISLVRKAKVMLQLAKEQLLNEFYRQMPRKSHGVSPYQILSVLH